jgi:hypothetical protein
MNCENRVPVIIFARKKRFDFRFFNLLVQISQRSPDLISNRFAFLPQLKPDLQIFNRFPVSLKFFDGFAQAGASLQNALSFLLILPEVFGTDLPFNLVQLFFFFCYFKDSL